MKHEEDCLNNLKCRDYLFNVCRCYPTQLVREYSVLHTGVDVLSYFNSEDTACRYNAWRPKVHHIALDWLAACVGQRRFTSAIDIACGTGDSTAPLTEISGEVLGIDQSESMLNFARARGLDVRCLTIDELDDEFQFDLISTCMAFHWFDAEKALRIYKQISTSNAIWLIYNFYFGGHRYSTEFNSWLRNDYLREYPTPSRNTVSGVIPKEDPEVRLLSESSGIIDLSLSTEELVGYLTTQSNIEHIVQQGGCYESISNSLFAEVSGFDLNGPFNYHYTYELYCYSG